MIAPTGQQLQTAQPQQQQQQSTSNQQSGSRVQMVSGIPRKFQGDQEQQDSMMNMMPLVTDAALLESLAEVTQNIEDQQTQNNEKFVQPFFLFPLHYIIIRFFNFYYSMSGTGTVAIDNKIEQAMVSTDKNGFDITHDIHD